jgi:hypothetical protein
MSPRGERLARWSAALALSLLFFAPAAAEEPASWVAVEPENEPFSVRMPVAPERQVKETSTFLGTVEEVSYVAEHGEVQILATRVDLPTVATMFLSDESLLDRIRDSYIEKGNGTEKSYTDVTRDGVAGKRLDLVMDKPGGKEDARAEFFLVDDQMVSFTGMVPLGTPLDEVDRYLETIELRVED